MSEQLDTMEAVLRSRARAERRHRYLQALNIGELRRDDTCEYGRHFTQRIITIKPKHNGPEDQGPRNGGHRYQQGGESVFGRRFYERLADEVGPRFHFDRTKRPVGR